MSPSIATLVFFILILGLFWLDRDGQSRVSKALWIPVIWLSLAGSRSLSEWLQAAPPASSSAALLEGDPINRFTYSCLIGLGLIVFSFRWRRVLRLLQANGVIVIFLLYCALSLTWADYPDVGFKRWVKTVGDFIMVLIVLSERDPPAAIRRLLTRTGFLLIPLSLLMIKYYPDLARYYDRWDWSTYFSGVTTNKNSLGVICLLFGLTSAWQFLAALNGGDRPGRPRRLLAHGAILAIVLWLFKLANSMTSLICFLLGIVVLLVVQFRAVGRTPLVVHSLVAFLIAFPSAVLFVGIESILQMIGKDPTLTDRTVIWDMLLTLMTNPWLGMGFENFWLGPRLDRIWAAYSWAPNQAHNGYLEIYLNLGWIGVGLLVTILLMGYQTVLTGLRRSPSTGNLMLAFFVVGIVYNFTEAALFRMMAPAWFALLLAITKVPDLHRPTTLPPARRGASQRMAPVQPGPYDKVPEHAFAKSRNA